MTAVTALTWHFNVSGVATITYAGINSGGTITEEGFALSAKSLAPAITKVYLPFSKVPLKPEQAQVVVAPADLASIGGNVVETAAWCFRDFPVPTGQRLRR